MQPKNTGIVEIRSNLYVDVEKTYQLDITQLDEHLHGLINNCARNFSTVYLCSEVKEGIGIVLPNGNVQIIFVYGYELLVRSTTLDRGFYASTRCLYVPRKALKEI